MKNFKVIYNLLFSSILLVQLSCANNIGDQVPDEEKFLYAEKIPMGKVLYPEELNLKKGYVAIANRSADTLVYFYSTPDLKYLGRGCLHGEGPEEYPNKFLSFGYTTNDKIYTWDIRLNIREIRLDSTGSVKAENTFKLKRFKMLSDIYIIKDSLLLYNDFERLEIVKQDLASMSVSGNIILEKDDNKNPSFNAGTGKLIANDSVAVYLYEYKDRIDIYDINTLKKKKSIISSGKTSKIIAPMMDCNQYNVNGVAGKKYFYSTYVKEQAPDKKYVIRAYDYNGKLHAEYSFDIFPNRYAVDEENGYIYGYNSVCEDYFLRYEL
jgi:hypothetical protein